MSISNICQIANRMTLPVLSEEEGVPDPRTSRLRTLRLLYSVKPQMMSAVTQNTNLARIGSCF